MRNSDIDFVRWLVVGTALQEKRVAPFQHVAHHHRRRDLLGERLSLLGKFGPFFQQTAAFGVAVVLGFGTRREKSNAPGKRFVERRQLARLFGRGQADDRLRIADVLFVVTGFWNLIEESEELVVFPLRNRIEFVVVTPRTSKRQCHENSRCRVDAVCDVLHAILLIDDAALGSYVVVAIKTARDQLIERRLGQQVAG